MPFKLTADYRRVLELLKDGKPRDHSEICALLGMDGLKCSGTISILRRAGALGQVTGKKFEITDTGLQILAKPPDPTPLYVTRRVNPP